MNVPLNGVPKVSAILVTYNQSRFLARAVRSLLGQSYRDFELIVVDDCSPDGSGDLAEQLTRGTQARVVRHLTNSGQYRTYNQSLSLARGEYVLFSSGDDVNSPELLAREVEVLECHPRVAMVFSNVLLVDERNRVLCDLSGLQSASMPWLRHNYVHSGVEELPRLLNENYVVCIGCALIRKSALLEVGGWDETLPQAADWDLWLRFAARYDIAYVAEPLLAWRQHADTVTSRLRRSGGYYQDNIRVLEKAFAALPETCRHLSTSRPQLLARAFVAAAAADIAARRTEEGRARLATAVELDAGILVDGEQLVELLCRHGASLIDPEEPSRAVLDYVDRVLAALPSQPSWLGGWRNWCYARALWTVAVQARGQGHMAAVRRHASRAAWLAPRFVARRDAISLAPAFVPFGGRLAAAYRRLRPRQPVGPLAGALLGQESGSRGPDGREAREAHVDV